jgi:hypothetical protein
VLSQNVQLKIKKEERISTLLHQAIYSVYVELVYGEVAHAGIIPTRGFAVSWQQYPRA